jgi:hypothetical protein
MLKIGDTVNWSGNFGTSKSKPAKVTGIEHTRGGKYGDPVDEIAWSEVYGRNVCVDLDNGSWAYGSQIKRK